MTIKITSILLVLTLIACSGKNKVSNDNQSNDTALNSELNFKNFIVSKGKLGDIKLGMKISSIQNTLSKFSMNELESYDFGFDGGGKAFLYLYNEEPIFALIPAFETDSIIAIIGLHKDLIFESEVQVGMTVKEILKYYPRCNVEMNLMMGWEEIFDKKNDFILVFETDEHNQIGKYEGFDSPSKPINLKPKLTWITII